MPSSARTCNGRWSRRTASRQPRSGSHITKENSRAAVNAAATTCPSLTGVVMSVSKVPVNFSCANSRMVITGDPSQVDLPSGASSGLDAALRVLKGVQGTEQIRFSTSDIVRHALVGRIVAAYDKLGAKVKSLSQSR